MKRISLGLAFTLFVATVLAGCEPKPSVPIAPDVKEPDMSNMSKDDILRMKQGTDKGGTSAANAGTR